MLPKLEMACICLPRCSSAHFGAPCSAHACADLASIHAELSPAKMRLPLKPLHMHTQPFYSCSLPFLLLLMRGHD